MTKRTDQKRLQILQNTHTDQQREENVKNNAQIARYINEGNPNSQQNSNPTEEDLLYQVKNRLEATRNFI